MADADRVLVLDAGECVEYDHPHTLINAGGKFAQLVQMADGVGAAELTKMASDAFEMQEQGKGKGGM